MVSEIQQAIHSLMETILQPVTALLQELQQKKPTKANLSALQQALANLTKKPKFGDFLKNQDSSLMETQTVMDSGLPPRGTLRPSSSSAVS